MSRTDHKIFELFYLEIWHKVSIAYDTLFYRSLLREINCKRFQLSTTQCYRVQNNKLWFSTFEWVILESFGLLIWSPWNMTIHTFSFKNLDSQSSSCRRPYFSLINRTFTQYLPYPKLQRFHLMGSKVVTVKRTGAGPPCIHPHWVLLDYQFLVHSS